MADWPKEGMSPDAPGILARALDGLLGMVLAIPLTAFFVTAWRLVKHKYLEHEAPKNAG